MALHFSADEDIDSTFPTNVVVTSDGNCLWVPPGLFLSTCKIDITWFPFDDQKCTMKFGSWTYDGSAINLLLQGDGGDISSFISNGEWELVGKDSTSRTADKTASQRVLFSVFSWNKCEVLIYLIYNHHIIQCITK